MQEVFENIIEKLESEYEDIKEIYKRTKDMSFYFTFQGVNKAIEIVKKESKKRYHGHFGCNTNGEHERCNGCGLTDCKSRNKIWFGAVGDGTDTNVGNNGWIPFSDGVMPRSNGWYLVTNELGVVQEQRWSANHWEKLRDDAVVAWMELPTPYQPKGE